MTISGVVKIGGARGNDPTPLLRELAERTEAGEKWLLVHGGSGKMEDICLSAGVEPQYVISPSGYRSRFTGQREMDLFVSACSSISIELLTSLWGMNCVAAPVWPATGRGATAKCKDALRSVENGRTRILRGNRSGSVKSFLGDEVQAVWSKKALPVMPPLAMDTGGMGLLNVDGDRLAALAAASLGVSSLVILSNVPGLLTDRNDSSTLVSSGQVGKLMELAEGNMKRKVLACGEALDGGVKQVILADSRVERPLASALNGGGTTVCQDFTVDEE